MPWHIKREWGFPWPALVQVPPSDAFVRVSQAFLEVPYAISPTVQVTQAFAEVPYSVADQSVRVTQAFAEVVYQSPNLTFIGQHEGGTISLNLGTASYDRLVVIVAAPTRSAAPGRTVTGVTVDGNAATIHVQQMDAAQASAVAIASYVLASGVNGNVAAAYTASGALTVVNAVDIFAYVVERYASATPVATFSNYNGAGDATGSLAVSEGGFVIAGGSSNNPGGSGVTSLSFTAGVTATNISTNATGQVSVVGVGSASGLGAQTRTVTVSGNGTHDQVAAVSWV